MDLEAARIRQAGFSLLEVMIVTVILVVVISAIFEVLSVGLDTHNSASAMVDIQNKARRVLDRIANELQAAGRCTISPDPPPTGQEGTHTITFQPCTGYSGGSIQWGDVTTFAFEYASGEINDGEDNNDNGLIDEGIITRTLYGGETETLTPLVKEDGLSFNRHRSVITIKLEMEKRGAKGEIMETSLITAVQIKND